MTLDKWIALAACFAAFISALSALLAVRQSGLQRKLSYKPQILLRPQLFDYEYDDSTFDILNRIKMRDEVNSNFLKSDLAVNIGLGAALDLKVKWNYDSQEIIDSLNRNFNKLQIPLKIERISNGSFIKTIVHNDVRSVYREIIDDSIDYVLSYNQKPSPTEINFPSPMFSLICANLILSVRADEGLNNKYSKPTVMFEYKDIGGESYVEEFNVNIDFIYSAQSQTTTKMSGYLSFEKRKSLNKTIKRLQRLRQGYEDFIAQYDFNNNR